jgi:ParB family chromosome partitioning protein
MLTLALVENLQRADLTAFEEGQRATSASLGVSCADTQQQVADAVGKDRTTITNLLRIPPQRCRSQFAQ